MLKVSPAEWTAPCSTPAALISRSGSKDQVDHGRRWSGRRRVTNRPASRTPAADLLPSPVAPGPARRHSCAGSPLGRSKILAATKVRDDDTGEPMIAVGVGPSIAPTEFLVMTIADARALRFSLDDALVAPPPPRLP